MRDERVTGLEFSMEIDVDDLAVDASRVDAVITIEAASSVGGTQPVPAAEVLIMDRSNSMSRHFKIHEAQQAVCAAVDALPDGALFAIIAGNHEAKVIFPGEEGLALASPETKAAANDEVRALRAEGGTKIGSWLEAAAEIFAQEPVRGGVRHALLYSDGRNQHEVAGELDWALSACGGQFVCDVRGLGDDWDYEELLNIAGAMHGDVAAVLDVENLAADFTRLIRRAGRLVVPESYLRLRPDKRFQIASVAQVYPVQRDLTRHQPLPDGSAEAEVRLGPWEPGTQRYEVSLQFEPDSVPVDDNVRASVVEMLVGTPGGDRERCADAPLMVRRHSAKGFRTVRAKSVTQIARERQLTATMRACADAWLDQDYAEADAELAKAIQLATELGDVRLPLLRRVAADAPGGGYQIRPGITRGEMKRVGLDSRNTGRLSEAEEPQEENSAGPTRVCPECAEENVGDELTFCESCGHPLDNTPEAP